MQVTVSPAPKSTVVLEIELPAERLERAIVAATRRLGARTTVPGFRPGKAPRHMLDRVLGPAAIVDEAIDDLVDAAWREAVLAEGILPIARPKVEMVTAEEGKPVVFKATVTVRPQVALGDYRHFPFKPEIDVVDDAKVAAVVDELRDQQATLVPVEDRGAVSGDYAVIGYEGTRDGQAFEGGSAERMPLVLGEERLIPGFEQHLLGLRPGQAIEFDITFPDDYQEETLRGAAAHFSVTLRELRSKALPTADDDWARSLGEYADLDALHAEVRRRLERNALDRARHRFADRIIEYAVKNSSVDLPDLLVDDEVEVMHDELRSNLSRQGITEGAYLKVVGKAADDLHAEMRPAAEERAKTLLVLGRIAEEESVEVSDADVAREAAEAKLRFASQPKLVAYFDTDRARAAIHASLRRSRVVEKIIAEWLADHPDHPALPHLEDGEPEVAPAPALGAGGEAEAAVAVIAADPTAGATAGADVAKPTTGAGADEPAAAGPA